MASKLLGTKDISIFTSRILCKNPNGEGKEIVWHQDSLYWPLVPPATDGTPKEGALTREDIEPKVASIWLAMDDVDETNGPMDVLTFDACPESRNQSVPASFIKDSGGSTKAFDNFNLSLDETHLKPEL